MDNNTSSIITSNEEEDYLQYFENYDGELLSYFDSSSSSQQPHSSQSTTQSSETFSFSTGVDSDLYTSSTTTTTTTTTTNNTTTTPSIENNENNNRRNNRITSPSSSTSLNEMNLSNQSTVIVDADIDALEEEIENMMPFNNNTNTNSNTNINTNTNRNTTTITMNSNIKIYDHYQYFLQKYYANLSLCAISSSVGGIDNNNDNDHLPNRNFKICEIKQYATIGNLNRLKEIMSKNESLITDYLIYELYWRCITYNRLEIFQYLYKTYRECPPNDLSLLYDALKFNRRGIVTEILELDCINFRTCSFDIKQTIFILSLKTKEPTRYFNLLRKNKFDFSAQNNLLIINLSKNKDYNETFKYLIEEEYIHLNKQNIRKILHEASLNDNLKLIKYIFKLFPNSAVVDQYMLIICITNNYFRQLEYLLKRLCRPYSEHDKVMIYNTLYKGIEHDAKRGVVLLIEVCKIRPNLHLQSKLGELYQQQLTPCEFVVERNREYLVEYFAKQGYITREMIAICCELDRFKLLSIILNEKKPMEVLEIYKYMIDIAVKNKSFETLRYLFTTNNYRSAHQFGENCLFDPIFEPELLIMSSYTVELIFYVYENVYLANYFWRYILSQIRISRLRYFNAYKFRSLTSPKLNNICGICLEQLDKKSMKVFHEPGLALHFNVIYEDYILCEHCNYGHHFSCILQWIVYEKKTKGLLHKVTCPCCRKALQLTDFQFASFCLDQTMTRGEHEKITLDLHSIGKLYLMNLNRKNGHKSSLNKFTQEEVDNEDNINNNNNNNNSRQQENELDQDNEDTEDDNEQIQQSISILNEDEIDNEPLTGILVD